MAGHIGPHTQISDFKASICRSMKRFAFSWLARTAVKESKVFQCQSWLLVHLHGGPGQEATYC